MIGFTDLEKVVYGLEYAKWRNSTWGRMQCNKIKVPHLPEGMRYKRACAIVQGQDPDQVYLVPPIEPQYEEIFLKEQTARKQTQNK